MNVIEARILGRQLMEISEMVCLTTIQPDGYPHTRALFNLRNRKMFRRLWPFFKKHKDDYFTVFATSTSSNKVAHIKANPKVSVYYCDSESGRGLTLIGDAVIEAGMALKEAIWDPAWTRYYPRGISDPAFTVVSLKPTMARYYYNLEHCDFKI